MKEVVENGAIEPISKKRVRFGEAPKTPLPLSRFIIISPNRWKRLPRSFLKVVSLAPFSTTPIRYFLLLASCFLLLASCFLLLSCGHSSTLLPSSQDTPVPFPSSSAVPSLSQDQGADPAVFDWDAARQALVEAYSQNSFPSNFALPQSIVESEPLDPTDPFIQQVVSFLPGVGAGFGQADMNFWLLGPPYGGGLYNQSVDVVSLGNGGEIVLGFPKYFPIDGAGPDFIIFENPFMPRGGDILFVEPASVAVSQDGIHFNEFPCQRANPYTGCAGTEPVNANPDLNNLNPRDPAVAGGNPYDLATVGLRYIRFIRIRDANLNLGGDAAIRARQAGFDLDAISIIHGAYP